MSNVIPLRNPISFGEITRKNKKHSEPIDYVLLVEKHLVDLMIALRQANHDKVNVNYERRWSQVEIEFSLMLEQWHRLVSA